MREVGRRVIGAWAVVAMASALLPVIPTAVSIAAAQARIAASATPSPSPVEPDPTPSAEPAPTPTAEPTPTASPSPEPVSPPTPDRIPAPIETVTPPVPDPSPAPDDHIEHDGPTEPLTRELPPPSPNQVSPMRLSVAAYGPQPVFRLPFAPGQRWGASGSHADSDGIHRGAIDFAPLSSADKKVRTVAAGTVYRVSCANGWFLGVDHGGGWLSEYYHLRNAKSSLVGKWVEAGTHIGDAGQTLPCGGTPGASAHVHLSILNDAVDVPSGKRTYVAVSGIQFDNVTLRDSSGAYNGVWRNPSGVTVLTSRGVTCCLTASSRVGPTSTASLPDTDGNGIDDYSDATEWDTDLNQNGLPDLVGFGSSGVYATFNSGSLFSGHRLALSGFGTAQGWKRTQHPRMVIDVTGDGLPDVVGFASAGVYVSAGAGTSFAAPRRWVAGFGADQGWQVGRHHRVIVDVTGDGRPDVVGFSDAGVAVSRNTGSSFAPAVFWSRAMGSSSAAGGWTASRHPRMVVDVTGDGLADLVGFGNEGVYVARNTGNGFGALSRWSNAFGIAQGWSLRDHPRYVTDVDGDGRPDIVGFGGAGVYVARNTGSSFAARSLWTAGFGAAASGGSWRGDRHSRALADVNGDGRPDVVGFGNLATYVALNRSTSFSSSAAWTNDFGAREWTRGWMPRSLVDVNRDGRADVVGFARGGVHVALSSGSRFGAAAHWTGTYGWDPASGSWRVATHPRAIAF